MTPEEKAEYNRQWWAENPEKKAEYAAKRAPRTAEALERRRARNREWKAANRDRVRELNRKQNRKARGIKNATSETRSGPCDLCTRPCKQLQFDHDTATGLQRGWLCRPCNTALGCLGDNEAGLERALAYVRGRGRV